MARVHGAARRRVLSLLAGMVYARCSGEGLSWIEKTSLKLVGEKLHMETISSSRDSSAVRGDDAQLACFFVWRSTDD
jgi:hypothetical protein